ncbi:hypothetical protein NX722_02120 [Endozoicomonas gorgoniicola]|uniref:OTU domain-containing protein n=1 Tax=Endozoicomonas gorgoniicola TaxID=1234144 RepID=A0ABT3MQ08_9GAMM|nr:OTU domain-containing protein [Endozoicomonas gorgoniicola]MCW7551455.1 hypothetical protein [Endozoicomonas gorgoniicola]
MKTLQKVFVVVAIQASQCVAGMNVHIGLVKVRHDGFCFYHAVAKAIGEETGGRPLFERLRTFLSNEASASTHPMLEAHLSDAVVGSSIGTLANQLASTPPSLANRDSWAGMPELVAMVQMLGQPVLVWHVNQDLRVDEHSLLVTPDSILPVFSIEEGADAGIPAIQLVHAGSEWWPLETDDSLQSWGSGWEAYRDQVSGVLHEQLTAEHTGPDLDETDNDATLCEGWVYLVGEYVPEDLLILDRGSLGALQEIIFAASLPSLMEAYLYMKIELNHAISESDDISDPGFHWANNRFEQTTRLVDDVSRTLVLPTTIRIIETSMSNYLAATNVRPKDFMGSLLPTRRLVWDTLSLFQGLINRIVQRSGGLTFSGIYSSYLACSQKSDTTSTRQFDFSGTSFASLPSGQQHPARISVVQERVVIPFDKANPVHHILFSLYVSANTFQLVNHCLTLSVLQSSDRELAELFGMPQASLARSMIKSQIKEYEVVLRRIRAVIHALGHRYYPDYWQADRYQAISICEGRTIVFHSDDFQPREGWSHWQIPDPEEDEH